MALDPQLLEILACPEDKGPLLYFEDEDALYNPRLQAPLRDPGRHPGDARSTRPRRSTTPSTTGCWPRPRPRASSRPFEARTMTADRDRPDPAAASTRSACSTRPPACPSRSRRRSSVGRGGRRPARRRGHRQRPRARHGRQRHRRRRARRRRPARSCRCRSSWPRATTPPSFVDRDTLVIALSFSGDTEETVAGGRGGRRPAAAGCWRSAARRASWPSWPTSGARRSLPDPRRHPACPGPALGALAIPPLVALERHGPVPGRARVDRGRGRPAHAPAATSSSPTRNPAAELARRIGRTPADHLRRAATSAQVAATRWKTQINENAKVAGVRQRPARALPQRDLRLGPARRPDPPGLPAGAAAPRRRAPAGEPPLRPGRRACSTRSSAASTRCGPRARARWPSCSTWSCSATSSRLHLAAQEGLDPGPVPSSTRSRPPSPTAEAVDDRHWRGCSAIARRRAIPVWT